MSILKKEKKMESKNIYKKNIIVSELSDFFEELDDETEKRFLDILNKENFSLADGELSPSAWDYDSDEAFFCNLIRTYEQKENFFDENTCYEMIDKFSREYNLRLYKDDENMQDIIFEAKKEVWDEYANFLYELAHYVGWWRKRADFETQKSKGFLRQLNKICAEFDDESLSYETADYQLNDERVDMIATIEKSAKLLSELQKTTQDKNIEIDNRLKKAEKLLEKNQENEIFINNDISFEYLYDNNLFYRARKQREIF